jgi:hypothetical protein
MREPGHHNMGREMAHQLILMSVMFEYFGWFKARDHVVAAMRAVPIEGTKLKSRGRKYGQRSSG